MSNYTPTTKSVRDCYLYGQENADGTFIKSQRGHEAEFDRWLEQHDREVAELAWDKAVESIQYEDGSPVEIVYVRNPYRIKAGDSDE